MSFPSIKNIPERISELVNDYNEEKNYSKKRAHLESISTLACNKLNEQETEDCKKILKKIKVHSNDIESWNQISKHFIVPFSRQLDVTFNDLPYFIYSEIFSFLNLKEIHTIKKINVYFHKLIYNQYFLNYLLGKPLNLSLKTRMMLITSCGVELKTLDLSYISELEDFHVNHIAQSSIRLHKLILTGTRVTKIAAPSTIIELNLSLCSAIAADEFEKLKSSTHLEFLDLSNTKIEKLDYLPRTLKELNLNWCFKIQANEFRKIDYSFNRLEKLEVNKTTIDQLDNLPKTLRELNLTLCKNISKFRDLSLFPKLKKLDVSSTSINELGFLPKILEELSVILCKNLSGIEVEISLNHSFSVLKKMNLSYLPIKKLGNLPKNLQEIVLFGCTSCSNQELEKLTLFPKLQVIHLSEEFKDFPVVQALRKENKVVLFKEN